MQREFAPSKRWVQVGYASWYGKKFDGKPTASGEIFDMHAMTAAHRTLPLGTTARVTNLDNGKSVVLKINDRGPFVRGRILDCSYGAAKKLGYVGAGLAKVRIEVLKVGRERSGRRPAPGEVLVAEGNTARSVLDGTFTVQVGAFLGRGNALRFRARLRKRYKDAYVIRWRDYYRVRVGHLQDRNLADGLLQRLRGDNLNGYVTRND